MVYGTPVHDYPFIDLRSPPRKHKETLAEEEARRLCVTEPDLHACDDPDPFSTNEEEDDRKSGSTMFDNIAATYMPTKDDEDSLEPNQDR